LISGGGSALCAMPAPGVSLQEKQAITKALLLGGATIADMNMVRKHLSAIKGGRLAVRAAQARVVSLLISDIPRDDPSLIASAPTLADPTTCADALQVRIGTRSNCKARSPGLASARFESPAGRSTATGHSHVMLACAQDGPAAADAARRRGWPAHVLSDSMRAKRANWPRLAAIAAQVQLRNQPVLAPCVLLSGGSDRHRHGSRNRRSQHEFALALAIALMTHRHPRDFSRHGRSRR
jgi:hydroxypyruvate reductase